ncbi:MAG: hypothetical protein J4473_01455 [Candidatus Aenigmarchaeota archaeon]|nr:hypothetical protein [Candidatus Aenigmarchaeota archaeon]
MIRGELEQYVADPLVSFGIGKIFSGITLKNVNELYETKIFVCDTIVRAVPCIIGKPGMTYTDFLEIMGGE